MDSPIAMRPGALVAITLTLCLLAPLATADTGLIFRISRDGAPDSYLVGTMHSEDERVIGLLDQFAPLIEGVDTVAIEMLPDAVTMLAMGVASLLPPGQDLRGLIGCARFRALAGAAAELGISIDVLNRLRPWAAALALGMPASDSGRFLDMEIYLHAQKHQRQTIGLESAAEQLSVFQEMPEALQIEMLDEMVKNAAELPKQLEALTQAFLSGELAQLDQVARGQYADMAPEMVHWFDEKMLNQRNLRMLERMQGRLERGPMLIAVGSLHLGGDQGLVAGLRQRGFDVQRWPQRER